VDDVSFTIPDTLDNAGSGALRVSIVRRLLFTSTLEQSTALWPQADVETQIGEGQSDREFRLLFGVNENPELSIDFRHECRIGRHGGAAVSRSDVHGTFW
jgi:hypothetical protein